MNKIIKGAPKRNIDYFMLILTIALVLFGILMVFSASYYNAASKYGNGLYFFNKQILGAIIGLVMMIVLSFIDYHILYKFRYIALIGALILLGLVLIKGIGKNLNGASRWLVIGGVYIQPIEIVKFAIVLFFSSNMADKKEYMRTFKYGIFPYLLIMGVTCVLLILQPNFSGVVTIALLCVVMMMVGGSKLSQLGGVALLGGGAVTGVMLLADYRIDRLVSFLDPWKYANKEGYQLIQSLYAIGAAGLFGCGIGNSKQKYLYLPYGESDFIFSIICEELGIFGAIALIVVFLLLIWRGVRAAMKAPDTFGTLLATGIVAVIAIQVVVHIAVATGSIPTTGVVLPFISAGNSSLVMFMSAMGVLLNISKQGVRA